uniref:Uncharacterized protein n=1 Tax=Anopheles melas TaxID=34690 RepID=A0A182TH38_9DIPT
MGQSSSTSSADACNASSISSSESSDCCDVSSRSLLTVVGPVVGRAVTNGNGVVGRTVRAIISEAGFGWLNLLVTILAPTNLILAGLGLAELPPLHQRLARFAQVVETVAYVIGTEEPRDQLLDPIVGYR